MKTNTQIEPGLLPLFRLTIGLWLVMQILRVFVMMARSTAGFSSVITPAVLIGLLVSLFMLFYLHSVELQQRLGWWFLPIGLAITTISPLITQTLSIGWQMDAGIATESAFATRSMEILFFPLFFSMIFIAVQYGFRAVIAYLLVTAVLEMISFGSLISIYGQAVIHKRIVVDIPFDMIMKRVLLQGLTGFLIARAFHGQKVDRKALGEKNIQLAQYAAAVEQLATSHERNRMARELHDTLAHTLSAVSVQLQALSTQFDSDPDGARQTLERTTTVTRNGLKEVRRALQALRASPLEDLGLVLALRHLLEASADRVGINIDFNISDDLDGQSFEVEQSLYRITEEAVNNAIRHSNAQNITVSLSQDNGVLQLTVADDGDGFDAGSDPEKGHFGIQGMQERALLCNAQLSIDSEPGKGTTVNFIIEV